MLSGGLVAWRRRWLRPAAATVAGLLLVGGLVGAVSYELADRLLHPPRELRDATPAWRGLDYERIGLATDDGVPLVGWWVPAEEARGTVVFLHGYGASKAQSLAVLPFLHRAGYHVLTFDFRAHGESGGTYTTVGLEEARDVRAAVEWLRGRPEAATDRVALFGWSMGGAAALIAAPDLPEVEAVITDSTFARLDNVVSHSLSAFTGLPHRPFGTLSILFASWMAHRSVTDNEPVGFAQHLGRPLLVIQGDRDPIARAESDGEPLARAAGVFGELWIVPEADHVNARRADPAAYEARVVEFLGRHLAPVADLASE